MRVVLTSRRLSARVGMIEWMSGTLPLKDVLLGSLTDQEQRFINSK